MRRSHMQTYTSLLVLLRLRSPAAPQLNLLPAEDSTQYPEEGRLLPNNELVTVADETQLEKITKRMGLEEKGMVALLGGLYHLNLPAANDGQEETSDVKKADLNDGQERTPDDKRTDLKFDNSCFIHLEEKKDQPDNKNPVLKGAGFLKWVETCAKDKDAFLKDYAAAHKKAWELGMSVATSGKGDTTQTDQKSSASGSRNRVRLVQGIGIAVVTTAIILGFFLSRRTK